MKKVLFFSIIIVLGICVFFSFKSIDKIDANEVSKITIIKGNQQVIKHMTCENDRTEIKNMINIYNESKRYYSKGDTTPSHSIVITLKNGKTVEIQGNTQRFHYVYKNGKHYKISNPKLTTFFSEITHM